MNAKPILMTIPFCADGMPAITATFTALMAQLWRYRTADPKQVRLIWKEQHSGYGYGVNYKTGYLDGKITDDGEFIPAPRNEATK